MEDRGYELSFSQDIRVGSDIRIDISIRITPMTAKFDMQVHLEDLTHETNWAGAGDAITSRSRDKLKHLSDSRLPMTTKLGRLVT